MSTVFIVDLQARCFSYAFILMSSKEYFPHMLLVIIAGPTSTFNVAATMVYMGLSIQHPVKHLFQLILFSQQLLW